MKRSKAASISTSSQARSLLPDYPWGERLKLPDDGCYVRTTTVEKLKHPESDYLNNQKLAKLQLLENMTTFLRTPQVEKRGFGPERPQAEGLDRSTFRRTSVRPPSAEKWARSEGRDSFLSFEFIGHRA